MVLNGATVTLSGAATGTGVTGADGNATISVNAGTTRYHNSNCSHDRLYKWCDNGCCNCITGCIVNHGHISQWGGDMDTKQYSSDYVELYRESRVSGEDRTHEEWYILSTTDTRHPNRKCRFGLLSMDYQNDNKTWDHV